VAGANWESSGRSKCWRRACRRRHDEVADTAEMVGKNRGVKSRRLGEAAVVGMARQFCVGSSPRAVLTPALILTIAARTAKEGTSNDPTRRQTLSGVIIIISYCSLSER
jgi:hypothetical protein